MIKMSWREYLELPQVKTQIKEVKARKKAQMQTLDSVRYGDMVEKTIANVLTQSGFNVQVLPPQMDIGFGADLKISYKKEGKNYSFFIDVTAAFKKDVKYLNAMGKEVERTEEAFGYKTESFTIYFGTKRNHHWFFRYEKPVVVLCVKGFRSVEISEIHIHNLHNILVALHEHLLDEGCLARASQMVYPNPRLLAPRILEQKLQTV